MELAVQSISSLSELSKIRSWNISFPNLQLDANWSEELEGVTIIHHSDGTSLLSGPFPLTSQHIRSDQIVSEREGAMGTRRNQEILPMGREEQGVEAQFKGPRMQVENPAAGVMAIHGEPPSVEGIAGGRKDEEVQTSSGAISVAIQARVSTVVERVVQGVEIGTLRNGCPGRVEITVVVDHILLQACDRLNGRTMTNCSMRAQVGSHHLFALDLH